jgi:ribosomal protein L36
MMIRSNSAKRPINGIIIRRRRRVYVFGQRAKAGASAGGIAPTRFANLRESVDQILGR